LIVCIEPAELSSNQLLYPAFDFDAQLGLQENPVGFSTGWRHRGRRAEFTKKYLVFPVFGG
jgi:hypothetical protein